MRTTIDLPDELFRQAKAQAALDGVPFKDLVARWMQEGLRKRRMEPAGGTIRRADPPIARPKTGKPLPVFSNAELYGMLDEE